MIRIAVFLSITIFSASVLGFTVNAQSDLKDHDTYQPLDIDAERFELRQRDGQAVFSGTVKVTQGKLILSSDSLTVFYASSSKNTNPSIDRLDARGGVKLFSSTEQVVSDWSVYDVNRRLVTFGGNVTLTQGDNILNGERLELDLVSGLTKLDGESGKNDGRVRGTFNVPESNKSNQ
jgi:lipopolysaccharide export system protein LptA